MYDVRIYRKKFRGWLQDLLACREFDDDISSAEIIIFNQSNLVAASLKQEE